MITKTKKRSVSVTSITKTTTISTPLTLCISKSYDVVKLIAQQFGAQIAPRKGFGFIPTFPMNKLAVWCINLFPNPYWTITLSSNGRFITERKNHPDPLMKFYQKATTSDCYKPDVIRLTFGKDKIGGKYKFLGLYKLIQVNYEDCSLTFERIQLPLIQARLTRKITKAVTVIEEEETTLTLS